MIRWPWVSRAYHEQLMGGMEGLLLRAEARCDRLQIRLEECAATKAVLGQSASQSDKDIAERVLQMLRRTALRQAGDTMGVFR